MSSAYKRSGGGDFKLKCYYSIRASTFVTIMYALTWYVEIHRSLVALPICLKKATYSSVESVCV